MDTDLNKTKKLSGVERRVEDKLFCLRCDKEIENDQKMKVNNVDYEQREHAHSECVGGWDDLDEAWEDIEI